LEIHDDRAFAWHLPSKKQPSSKLTVFINGFFPTC
jgi:hypothetical protein